VSAVGRGALDAHDVVHEDGDVGLDGDPRPLPARLGHVVVHAAITARYVLRLGAFVLQNYLPLPTFVIPR